MIHRRQALHDVFTLGARFGVQPKPALLDLAVRLSHADKPRNNLHVLEGPIHSAGPAQTRVTADPGENILDLVPACGSHAARTAS